MPLHGNLNFAHFGKFSIFSAINDTVQSFNSAGVSELEIEWDNEVKTTLDYTHNEIINPENIKIEAAGWAFITYKINLISNFNNRILARAQLEITPNVGVSRIVHEATTYGYARRHSYVDVLTMSLPLMPINLTEDDTLKIKIQHARNDDLIDIGDSNTNLETISGESTITIVRLLE